MQTFLSVVEWLSRVPAAVPLLVLPALVPVSALVCALFRAGRAYPVSAIVLGAAGLALVSADDLSASPVYFALFLFLAGGCYPLTLIRFRKIGRESRAERLYRKFGGGPETDSRPPKVCCFVPPPAGEGTDVTHAVALIEKLRTQKLSPADRLELDALSRAVEGCRTGEGGILNDSLAAILRLTAKYRL